MITTKITGLSAQGADEYKGLAYSNNDVAITMASDNATNDGFKYVFNVIDGLLGNSYKFYVAPNHQLNGVFNAKTILNQLVPTPMVVNNNVLIHTSAPFNAVDINTNAIQIQCWEGWKVGGVFTEYTTDFKQYDLMVVYGSGKQNFIVMGTNDTLPLALSQGYDSTLGFNNETINASLNLPVSLQSEIINWRKISRSNVTGEQDSAYNVMTWIADNGTYLNPNYPMISMNYFDFNLYDESNSLLINFIIPYTSMGGALFFLPTGLKNLVNGGYIDQTTADNTAYWTLEGKNGDDVVVTAKYGFYIEEDCKYNPVHLYWLNQLGGWDTYSFIKKNERSIEVEKKRYKQYQGDYNNATTDHPFSTESFTRSLTEREPIVKTFLNVQSDWIAESEFKFMKDLFRSKSVWMVDDNVDGYSVVPVVVEDTNYLMRRERNSRKYNQSLRLQIANDNETLNTTVTQYPIPSPVACHYYNVFTKIGGNTELTLGANTGNACTINVTAATRDRWIQVSLADTSGGTPIAGETYYVRLDYDFTTPATPVRMGYIDLGNTTTGGGTRTYLGGLLNPGTPIIATGVWGTGTGTNSFSVKLPGWTGATVTGHIYVTVGFGNCP
jgi:hypothetical protein